jgi:pyruvate/2-oxoglutarate dehydrogenase complex dihydrolipoamide dehydrogenase (E3) component
MPVASVMAHQHQNYDIVVLGGTSAGYVVAIQAARLDRTVALLES